MLTNMFCYIGIDTQMEDRYSNVRKKAKVTERNDYRHVALTSVIMKCFERLVKDHITSTLPYLTS